MNQKNIPYYAVIFTSKLKEPHSGYDKMARYMEDLASKQEGFLCLESVRGKDQSGITISYWSSLEAIELWKNDLSHLVAQKKGKENWYDHYKVRIARVEREYGNS